MQRTGSANDINVLLNTAQINTAFNTFLSLTKELKKKKISKISNNSQIFSQFTMIYLKNTRNIDLNSTKEYCNNTLQVFEHPPLSIVWPSARFLINFIQTKKDLFTG